MAATIWNATNIKALLPALQLGNNAVISSGATDPSAVAFLGNAGDVYISTSTNKIYIKTDSGSTTNWGPLETQALANGHIFVGNSSGLATDVAPTGDISLTNAGVTSVAKIAGTTVSGTTGTTNVVFSNAPTLTGNIGLGAAWTGLFSSSEGTDITKSVSADAGTATSSLAAMTTRTGTAAQVNNVRGARFSANRDVTAGNSTGDGGGFYGATSNITVTNGANNWTNAGPTAGFQIHEIVTTGAGNITTTYAGLRIEADTQAVTGTMSAIYAGAPTGGTTGNAVLVDNTSYTGTWFIKQSGNSASQLGGTLTAPNFISATGTTSTSGILQLANTDTIGWRNSGNSANQTFGLDSNNLLKLSSAGTSIIAVDSTLAGVPSLALQFQDTNAGNTAKNWRVGANIIANGNLDFVPSTAAAGTTFSTTALTLKSSGSLVSGQTGDVTDPAFQVLVGGSTKAGMSPSSNGCSFAYNSTEVFWFTSSTISMAEPVLCRFNGSASTVQLYFKSGETNSGFYSSAANETSYSNQGTQTLKLAKNAITVLGQETITGAADVVQFTLTGNATQTSNLILVQNSASAALFTLNNSGNGAFTGTVTGSNLSGTNTGDVSLGAVGSSPNGNSASLSGQVLTLQPADGTNPGILSNTTQTILGAKTFSTSVASPIHSTNAANPATTGIIRLSNADNIGWRNASNAANYTFGLDANNLLNYNTTGTSVLAITSSLVGTPTLALRFQDTDAGNSFKNWQISANSIANGNLEFIPSTLAAGTTFSTAVMSITSAGVVNLSGLTASQAVFTDSSKNLVSNAITGTGSVVMSDSPTFTTKVSLPNTTSFDSTSLKIGTASTLLAANEQLTQLYTLASPATSSSRAQTVRIQLTGDTQNTNTLRAGRFNTYRGPLSSTNPNDTGGMFGFTTNINIDTGSGNVNYTSTGTVCGLNTSALAITGTGTLTFDYSSCELSSDNTAVTGRKRHLFFGALSGGTVGNAFIADNNSYSGSYFINSTSNNTSLLSGQLNLAQTAGVAEASTIDFNAKDTTPASPASSSDMKMYLKTNKIVFQYNDGGTVRYKYLDLTGTGVTWVHTTSAP